MSKLADFTSLLFDVDNTLNNSQKVISPATIQALSDLQPKYYTAICTGRIYAALEKYVFPYFPANSVHIICGGAQLVRTTGEVLWEKTIPEKTSAALCKILSKAHIDFLLSQEEKMYATSAFKARLTNGSVPISFGEMDDLRHWETPLISIPQFTDQAKDILNDFPELSIKEMARTSGGSYADITAEGVNKASALEKWSEITGMSLDKAIGFGDSSNDIEFLQKVGFSVAMGNSIPVIKALSKRVIGHTDQDGLAVYLQKILQGDEL